MGCRSWKAWGPTAGLDCKWKRESLEGFELTALFRPSFNRAAWLPGGEQTEAAAGAGARTRGEAATTRGEMLAAWGWDVTVSLACILKAERDFLKDCVGMRKELRIWPEHLAGPPCPPCSFREPPPGGASLLGAAGEMTLWRRGSRGVEQATEVSVRLGWGTLGSGGQAEDRPGNDQSVLCKVICCT